MTFHSAFTQQNNATNSAKEEHWIPLADLMAGLMMIFMLIAIIFMVKVESDAKKVKDIALVYNEMKAKLYQDLHSEFKENLSDWGAELDQDLTFRFKEPSVLFDMGKDNLKPKFIQILDNFFPRYIQILDADKYRDSIEEIRIEGHTSSIWNNSTNSDEAYFLNMTLSQSRTRSTLQHVLALPQVQKKQPWLKAHLTANGLSSSRLIYHTDGTENREGSQRVEFKVRTNADARISEILKTAQQ
ncbi:Outer membrane protein OmpA [Nitrosomonas eutropha]|uniref:Outer membrane protein OmpA n=1 Tax=Nitrosomonas eutropha TaxID=916 RepID=A0A1I7GA98_9PROT|nr:OmpA family protein [Nitrosomonas eutropha]SFU45362.1 Outer membrane protein OmpA [Nitrosomonas eutropha]